jgi:DNA-binding transcriptional MerR regulator
MARGERLTIDELAQRTGVASRNIRYYQTRGLLPPPNVKGRTGYYGAQHVERLGLIQELQAEGLNLQAIGWLLGGSGRVESDELRRLKRAVLDSWVEEEPVEVPEKTVLRGFRVDSTDDPEVQRAVELGLIAPSDEPGRWRVLLPGVVAAGNEMVDMGADVGSALDVLERMREHAAAVAQAHVELFDEAVLAPWDARGRPEGEWRAIREAVDRMRPLAGEAVLAVFRQEMAAAVADRLAETANPQLEPPLEGEGEDDGEADGAEGEG